MERFPADAAIAALAHPIAGDAVADAADAAKVLAVDVTQLAGSLALLADRRRRRAQRLGTAEAKAAQHGANRRTRRAGHTPDRRRLIRRRNHSISAARSAGTGARYRAGQ
jgi:hypothetical protein